MGPDEAKRAQPELPTKQGFRFTDGTVMIKDLATGIYRNPANQRPALSKRERAKIKRQAKKQPLAPAAVRARIGAFFA